MNLKEQMDLLGIQDVTTNRQHRNGTVVWRLPIKNNNSGKTFIEVASFSTGYVRNQNSGYSNYQLNKRCDGEPEYFQLANGDYRKFTTRSCKLIPNEIDRLEYLIAYCLKNYYIKNANQVVDGKYISKWYHEYELERANSTYSENTGAMHRIDELESEVRCLESKYQASQKDLYEMQQERDCARLHEITQNEHVHYDRIKDLEARLELKGQSVRDLEDQVYDLANKLSNAISPTKYESVKQELAATKIRQDVSVIVNGHRYKVL